MFTTLQRVIGSEPKSCIEKRYCWCVITSTVAHFGLQFRLSSYDPLHTECFTQYIALLRWLTCLQFDWERDLVWGMSAWNSAYRHIVSMKRVRATVLFSYRLLRCHYCAWNEEKDKGIYIVLQLAKSEPRKSVGESSIQAVRWARVEWLHVRFSDSDRI